VLAKRALSFLTLCALLGGAGALLASPVVIAAGLSTRSGVDYWDTLPTELVEPALPVPSVLYADDGKTVLTNLFEYWRAPVTLDAIAPIMATAMIDIEDTRFYTHGGVDPVGIGRAVIKGGGRQGASTLTQQYVKNTLALAASSAGDTAAAAAASAPTAVRKLREARYALALEHKYTKAQILTKYLNIVSFGAGAYGVQAGAERYFGVPAAKLSLPQAATLAGLVQDPNGYDPTRHPGAAKARRNVVLSRMWTVGTITAAQRDAAVAVPLGLHLTWPVQGCAQGPAPLFCDWVVASLAGDKRLGATAAARRHALYEGGLSITTTLNLAANKVATTALRAVLAPTDRVADATVTVIPGTGAVHTMATSRTYGTKTGQSVFPLASSPSYQAGSAFKVFTLAAAFEKGLPLDTRLPGGNRYTSVLDNPSAGYFTNAGDGEGSNLTLASATAASVNTAFVQLIDRVGVRAVADVAHRAGISSVTGTGPGAVNARQSSLTLGVNDVSVLDMANAYATFAAHGLACVPSGVTSVRAIGEPARAGWGPVCSQKLTPEVADTVTTLLVGVLTKGGTAAAHHLARPAAGKTGTTTNYGAAWFVGYTPGLSTAVWMGDPRGPSHPIGTVGGVTHVYGGTWPATIWANIMGALPDKSHGGGFRPANPGYLTASTPHPVMPTLLGMSAGAAAAALAGAGLDAAHTTFTITDHAGPWPPWSVWSQIPAPGASLRSDTVAGVRVAGPAS